MAVCLSAIRTNSVPVRSVHALRAKDAAVVIVLGVAYFRNSERDLNSTMDESYILGISRSIDGD